MYVLRFVPRWLSRAAEPSVEEEGPVFFCRFSNERRSVLVDPARHAVHLNGDGLRTFRTRGVAFRLLFYPVVSDLCE